MEGDYYLLLLVTLVIYICDFRATLKALKQNSTSLIQQTRALWILIACLRRLNRKPVRRPVPLHSRIRAPRFSAGCSTVFSLKFLQAPLVGFFYWCGTTCFPAGKSWSEPAEPREGGRRFLVMDGGAGDGQSPRDESALRPGSGTRLREQGSGKDGSLPGAECMTARYHWHEPC